MNLVFASWISIALSKRKVRAIAAKPVPMAIPQGVKAVAMGAVLVTNRAINRKKLSQIYKLKQYPSPELGIFFDKD
ncbi:hypothetical protein AWQ22_12925 [Picosynechococcus sp. PCC 7117]|nr:hypothetical protein AWQ22_12925 [Picosynechococcus sp. PCC 7117]